MLLAVNINSKVPSGWEPYNLGTKILRLQISTILKHVAIDLSVQRRNWSVKLTFTPPSFIVAARKPGSRK